MIAKRNLLRIPRQPDLWVSFTLQPLMFVLLFVYVFGGAIQTPGYDDYVDFLMPGIIVQTMAFGGFVTAIGLSDDLRKGLIDRFRSLPMARSAVLAGRTLADVATNVVSLTVMVVVGLLVGFNFTTARSRSWAASCSCWRSATPSPGSSPSSPWSSSSAEGAQALGFLLIFPLTFASSAFVPPESMPAAIQAFAEANPISTIVDATRALFVGGPAGNDVWAAALWIVGPDRGVRARCPSTATGARSAPSRVLPIKGRKPDWILVLSDMEPVSAPPAGGATSARASRGPWTTRRCYENVPGHIIPILEREFDDFDNEAEKYLDGQTPENEFIGFRLKQGVYGQRQADVQMIRTKLPFGGITPEQMEKFADVVEQYAPLNKGHITTRQNIQLHHIPLRDAAKAIRELSDAGLSSREGCGNTVRNVTGDPWAGVCEGELFDPTPYVGRLRALLRPPPHHAADAAQGEDGLHGHRRGPRDHRHPRRGLHPAHPRRREGLRDARGRRHLDHAARRADAARVRRAPTTAST